MEIERALHMVGGDGSDSYATNSRLPMKAIMETKPVLCKAIEGVFASLSSPALAKIVIADLGCSSGPNTLLVVSGVIGMISTSGYPEKTELQFFLNDLPGNDFNYVFRSLQHLKQLADPKEGLLEPPYYIAGLPGSFYTRLFPCQSVHLFHSSYALMWRSKVPEELSSGVHLNEGNIYIGKATPSHVIKLFQKKFKEDFSLFLALRSEELVSGGHMVLTFLGRKSSQMMAHGDVGTMWELLAEALQILVQKGRMKEEDLTTFNLPYYAPSVDEVTELIEESGLFDVEHTGVFESSWDPHDDSKSNGDAVVDCARSADSITNCSIRAVIEPLITDHFGESIVDELFQVYVPVVAKHLEKGRAMYPVIVVSLKGRL
ncbi:anthranilate O-methyltransferase 2-like [Oryza glaberrima]|nr:anthranilate O-methyltransferase 2-like [Oryza glaberrima]